MLELYHSPMSPCAQKVRTVLAEKGLEWKSHHLDLRGTGDKLRPEYLKLNPNGVVPTLVDDGRVIIESTVINEYLDDAFPRPALRPADAVDRARMRLWTKRMDDGGHDAVGVLSFATATRHTMLEKSPDELEAHLNRIPEPGRREWQRQTIAMGIEAPAVAVALALYETLLHDMEETVADGPWLAGDGFSLADAAIAPYVTRLDYLQMSGLWTADRPLVTAWYERVRARPSYTEAIADLALPDDVARMKAHGAQVWPQIKAMLEAV